MLQRFINIFSLFGSVGTLLCCALPTLLVSIGMGATVAGLVSAAPQLVWLSERKGTLFLVSGLLLCLAGWGQWAARRLPCPLDPRQAMACKTARRWSLGVFLLSGLLYAVGIFFAYIGPWIWFS